MKTYQGGCHCGAIRYEAKLDLAQEVLSCNCSMCAKRGGLLAFTTQDNFKLTAGHGRYTTYRFNSKTIDHNFCTTCGIASFSQGKTPDGQAMLCINVRCLDGVEPKDLKIKEIDGRSF